MFVMAQRDVRSVEITKRLNKKYTPILLARMAKKDTNK